MEDTQNNSLPLDLVISILLKLPEKSLVRFRCVSKSWLTLITSERFIRLYLQTNNQIQSQNSNGSNSFILIGINTILTYDFSGSQVVSKLPSPPILLTRHSFIGSANGLICFLPPNPTDLTISSITIALYNPTTKAFSVLPALERRGGCVGKHNFGFGYDYKSSDFKIVSLQDIDRPYIYRPRSNSWELIKSRNFGFTKYEYELSNYGSRKTSVFSNNALHWQFSGKILGFNLATEEFYWVPLPEWCSWHDSYRDLADLRGCLHLLISTNFDNQFNIGIWVMKKYGVKESWTKLLHYTSIEVFDLFICTSTIRYPSHKFEPRLYAYSKDDQEILISVDSYPEYFFSCHLQTREVKKVEALCNLREEAGKRFSVVPWTCTFALCD